jgi:ABC-type polar amino acid transport system ATPase subunit
MAMLLRAISMQLQLSGRQVLDRAELYVKEGERVAIIGPSGCGKSTLLRCLNGLQAFDQGKVEVVGEHLLPWRDLGEREFESRALRVRQQVGMVFQSFNLFPHMSLCENLMRAPMVVQGLTRDLARERAEILLRRVGLADFAEHYPQQLSGGQQQRGAIARALAMSPKVMLYDEPTSALDPEMVSEVLAVMSELSLGESRPTQILVTHELKFAERFADRVCVMNAGRIVEEGPPEQVFNSPQHPLTQKFLRHFV